MALEELEGEAAERLIGEGLTGEVDTDTLRNPHPLPTPAARGGAGARSIQRARVAHRLLQYPSVDGGHDPEMLRRSQIRGGPDRGAGAVGETHQELPQARSTGRHGAGQDRLQVEAQPSVRERGPQPLSPVLEATTLTGREGHHLGRSPRARSGAGEPPAHLREGLDRVEPFLTGQERDLTACPEGNADVAPLEGIALDAFDELAPDPLRLLTGATREQEGEIPPLEARDRVRAPDLGLDGGPHLAQERLPPGRVEPTGDPIEVDDLDQTQGARPSALPLRRQHATETGLECPPVEQPRDGIVVELKARETAYSPQLRHVPQAEHHPTGPAPLGSSPHGARPAFDRPLGPIVIAYQYRVPGELHREPGAQHFEHRVGYGRPGRLVDEEPRRRQRGSGHARDGLARELRGPAIGFPDSGIRADEPHGIGGGVQYGPALPLAREPSVPDRARHRLELLKRLPGRPLIPTGHEGTREKQRGTGPERDGGEGGGRARVAPGQGHGSREHPPECGQSPSGGEQPGEAAPADVRGVGPATGPRELQAPGGHGRTRGEGGRCTRVGTARRAGLHHLMSRAPARVLLPPGAHGPSPVRRGGRWEHDRPPFPCGAAWIRTIGRLRRPPHSMGDPHTQFDVPCRP